ncbi:MAG: T9SS type A sorting domain-containing protein [Bacteroidales bacterium]|nr:T9SS type A sorting domain-containing protein [Bacteroidales bacterium]
MRQLIISFAILLSAMLHATAQTCGCTDPLATNYNASATVNDGSCVYSSATISATEIGELGETLDGSSTLLFWDGGYWTYNDHNDCCLYRIDSNTAAIADTLCISGISNYDTEEVSQDSLYLYFGDFGNNSGVRQNLHILRISKESLLDQTFAVDTIWFSYEDQTDFTSHPQATDFDCESFIVTADSIYLFTKQWASEQTTIYGLPKTPGTHVAHRLETYNVGGLVTGATYVPEYRMAVLCGYDYNGGNLLSSLRPFIILLYDFQGDNFFSGNKRRLDFGTLVKEQVEAVATSNAMDFYITNEHFTTTQYGITVDRPAKLQRLDLRDYLLPYLATFETEPEDTVPTDTIPTDTVPTDTIVTPPDTTGIPQFGTDGFRIYPNPASDRLHIDYPQDFEGANYEIMNLSGQKIAKGILREKSISLNNKHLKAGKYILVLRGKSGTKTFIFIKKE